ncbi:uncharacterized protein Bfra_003469 [Botrytis fragariae]|uniref:Uncharacterized protein n=1 Tax=Botrytis fragariae TaxID=1964551 RepID=A0A8H6AWR2_9HELO|nr:uncharacterized protein Bfra_003469 [Botrytis fragariae]KAF5875016.1 hypothetical protein Bfra_003469 [Botrytis fragariae]
MCQSTSVVFSCNHWGPRKISRPCPWATSENMKAGCFITLEPEGVEHLDRMCNSCRIKEDLGSTSTLTHVGIDGIRRPFTRDGIAASMLQGSLKEVPKTKADELNQAVDDLDEKQREAARINQGRRKRLSQADRLVERQKEQVLDQLHEQLVERERERHEEMKRKLKARYEGSNDED